MPKAKNPATFSQHFDIDPNVLSEIGVLDPTLAVDTKLFIDPLLLPRSEHAEASEAAVQQYETFFGDLITLLRASRSHGDLPWRRARQRFDFHEIKATCLGYGSSTIAGNSFGEVLTNQALTTAKEIVDLGIEDPALFPLLGLFEENIGADRISDMCTNVIIDGLLDFNVRILGEIEVPTETFRVLGRNAVLPRNPFQGGDTPILLVPNDVLRPLPIATSWDEIADAAQRNQALRNRVNDHIGHLWQVKSKRDKAELRRQALASRQAFSALLEAVEEVEAEAYDLALDSLGLQRWAVAAQQVVANNPLGLEGVRDIETATALVATIIDQFRHLVENRGLNQALWHEDKALHESQAQLLFFAVAYNYCKANNLDVSPEIDTGTGKIDFKFSAGFDCRVLVELKKSSNSHLVSAYESQLGAYRIAEETDRAFYLIIDVGSMGEKLDRIMTIRNEAAARGDRVSQIEYVDARRRPPPSRR